MPFSWLHAARPKAQITGVGVRTCKINLQGETKMSAQDLPSTVRALSVVVAIALVATALAPVIFTAIGVVA
jgi:hypothetical protein